MFAPFNTSSDVSTESLSNLTMLATSLGFASPFPSCDKTDAYYVREVRVFLTIATTPLRKMSFRFLVVRAVTVCCECCGPRHL